LFAGLPFLQVCQKLGVSDPLDSALYSFEYKDKKDFDAFLKMEKKVLSQVRR
jgi:hypothetical protein